MEVDSRNPFEGAIPAFTWRERLIKSAINKDK
jgi:hypothetical protein